MREDNLCQHSSASGSLKIVQNCSDNCFADFYRKLLGNDVRLFQVHLRERLKSETANHEMIAKPTIVLLKQNRNSELRSPELHKE